MLKSSMNLSHILKELAAKKPKTVSDEKTNVRNKMKELKSHLSEIQKHAESVQVFEKIESYPEFQNAKTILIYWSMPDELPTHNFVVKWSKEKQMLLPVVKDNDMFIQPFSGRDKLVQGRYGIWEPEAQKTYEQQIDLVIVPGIAFDKRKTRLGRGKGYYDRYFMNGKIPKWGVCFDVQLMEKIPSEQFDVKMDKIITSSFTIE